MKICPWTVGGLGLFLANVFSILIWHSLYEQKQVVCQCRSWMGALVEHSIETPLQETTLMIFQTPYRIAQSTMFFTISVMSMVMIVMLYFGLIFRNNLQRMVLECEVERIRRSWKSSYQDLQTKLRVQPKDIVLVHDMVEEVFSTHDRRIAE